MSLLNQEKANENFCKFINNIQRVIGKTTQIIERIMKVDKNIATNYNDVYGTLKMANDLIINIDSEKQKKLFKTFIKKSLNLWIKIKNKDDSILTEHISIIFPNNPYVEKIQYIYGNNPQKKNFVEPSEMDSIWKLITGLVHNSIKYIIFSEDPEFYLISNSDKFIKSLDSKNSDYYQISLDEIVKIFKVDLD